MKQFNKNKELKKLRIKQNKNTYIKRISIVISCFILLFAIMYFTFAKFEQNSEEYTLINGKIKYLGGDINIVSYNYDGTSNSLPPNKNEGYILTNINCEGATGEWDDVNWELNISGLTNKVKCNLEFDKNSNYQIIKYNTNGGYLEEQYKKGEVGDQIGNLPTPVRTGYTFEGWYKEDTYTNKVENTTIIDTTITNLYAKYTENTITINTPGESNVLNYAKANIVIPSNGKIIKDTIISLNTSSFTDSNISTTDNIDKYVLYFGRPDINNGEYPGILKIKNNTIYTNKSDGAGWNSGTYATYSVLSNGNLGFKATWSGMTTARLIVVSI